MATGTGLKDEVRELRRLNQILTHVMAYLRIHEREHKTLRKRIEWRIEKQGEGITTWGEACEWMLQELTDIERRITYEKGMRR